MHRLSRRPSETPRVALVILWFFASLSAAQALNAQTMYTWTDDRGVIHFSDIPPANGQKYEERGTLPNEPAASGRTAPASAPDAAAAAASSKSDPGVSTPARVILVSHDSIPRSTDTRHLIGVVKNVGGRAAGRVAVTVHIASSSGQECGNEEVDVVPAMLEPGESANFDATISNNCFADGGTVDPEPHWD